MSNVEVKYPVYFKKTERAFVAEIAMQAKSDSTFHHSKFLVRYSAVRCSKLCVEFLFTDT